MSYKTINIIHSKKFNYPKSFKVSVNHWNITPNISFNKLDDDFIHQDSSYNNLSSFINNSRNNNSIIKQNIVNSNNNNNNKICSIKKYFSQNNSIKRLLYEKTKSKFNNTKSIQSSKSTKLFKNINNNNFNKFRFSYYRSKQIEENKNKILNKNNSDFLFALIPKRLEKNLFNNKEITNHLRVKSAFNKKTKTFTNFNNIFNKNNIFKSKNNSLKILKNKTNIKYKINRKNIQSALNRKQKKFNILSYENDKIKFTNLLFNENIDIKKKKFHLENFIKRFEDVHFLDELYKVKIDDNNNNNNN